MKNKLSIKVLSLLLVAVMMLSIAPFGCFGELFVTTVVGAEEFTEGFYTYTVESGEATITDVERSIDGEVTIPSTLGGYPVTSIGRSAFYRIEYITEIIIPNGVTSIDDRAFSFCLNLTEVTIPNSVTVIGDYAFNHCTSLINVFLPNSVIILGNGVFSGCESLTNIEVDNDNPNFLSEYGVLFNKSKTQLIQYPASSTRTYYNIPESVIEICESAFIQCKYLIEVKIPNGVKRIDSFTFAYSTSLTDITIPESVTSISGSAFYETGYYNDESNWENSVLYHNEYLISTDYLVSGNYTVKDGTKIIADGAFYYCENLTGITIPDSVITIGNCSFECCFALEYANIGSGVEIIGDGAFYCCFALTRIDVSEENAEYSSLDGVLFNKDKTELLQYPCGNTRESYPIPDGVKNIVSGAFEDCWHLKEVVISNSVTNISYRAFSGCGITSLIVPDSVIKIDDYAFDECFKLENITLNENLKSIGEYAFSCCESLKSIAIPNSVTEIGKGTFFRCDSITEITVGEENPNYSSYDGVLFNKEKTELIKYSVGNERTSYTMPNSVTDICKFAFARCFTLKNITLSENLINIGISAFEECTQFESVVIPESVNFIDNAAFFDCSNLRTIDIPDKVLTISAAVFWHTGYCNDKSNWENGVVYIGKHLIEFDEDFEGDCKVKEGTITIANSASIWCDSLESIYIPKSVKHIGESAFYWCSPNIIYYGGTEEDWNNITIGDDNHVLKRTIIRFVDYFNAKLPETETLTARYKNNVTVKITATGIPQNGFLVVDGKKISPNAHGKATFESLPFQADKKSYKAHIENPNGKIQIAEKEYKVEVDTSFFAKLIAFFKDFLFNGFKWREFVVEFK